MFLLGLHRRPSDWFSDWYFGITTDNHLHFVYPAFPQSISDLAIQAIESATDGVSDGVLVLVRNNILVYIYLRTQLLVENVRYTKPDTLLLE